MSAWSDGAWSAEAWSAEAWTTEDVAPSEALSASDLLRPAGRLFPALFPEESPSSLATLLDQYLTEAYASARIGALDMGADQNEAARWYAYALAFDAIALRLNMDAATVEVEDAGRRQRIKEQIQFWSTERDKAEARWEALAPPIVEDEDISDTPPSTLRMPSRSVSATFYW